MLIWRNLAEAKAWLGGRGTAVTIGTFDGLHLGHQAVLRTLSDLAREKSLTTLVVTFDQHPFAVLSGEVPPLLMPIQRRLEGLADLGVQSVLVISFDAAFAALDASAFARGMIAGDLGARVVVVGHDFRFGMRGAGDAALLAAVGEECGFAVTQVAPTIVDGIAVSSTAVRWALAVGDIAAANRFLGRPHAVRGEVVSGARRGRRLGFPTANLTLSQGSLWPRYGVYLVRISAGDSAGYHGLANVGVKPTFGSRNEPGIEIYLLDFAGDLYHTTIDVAFLDFVRPEKCFSSADELREQIGKDIARARDLLRGR